MADSNCPGFDFTLEAECRTDGTSPTGERRSCDSVFSELEAQAGCVFNDRELQKERQGGENAQGWHWLTEIGSENNVRFEFSNYIEIIPGSGLTYPTHIKFGVHARSKGGMGHIGERGFSQAVLCGHYIKYR